MELEMDCLTSISTKECASSRLVSQVRCDGWSKYYKEKVPIMCQIPIKMLKQHKIPNSSTIPNSSLHNLRIYSSKGCRETIQR